MEEWRLCVEDFERLEKLWSERLVPLNNIKKIISHRRITSMNEKIEIMKTMKEFIQKCIHENQEPDVGQIKDLHESIKELSIASFVLYTTLTLSP